MTGRWRCLAVLTVLALVLGGCAASPKTTYTNAAGERITVDWADYPAQAWTSVEDVLATPTVEETPARERLLVDEIGQALAAEFHTGAPRVRGEGGWHPNSGNGYGGTSMLTTFNSGYWRIEATIPREEWPRVLDTVEAVLLEHGLLRGLPPDPEDALEDTSGWMASTDFVAPSDLEWMWVTVQDVRRDEEAHANAIEYDWLVAGVSVFYGVTTIAEGDRDAFEVAAAPFAGLTRPAETHSD